MNRIDSSVSVIIPVYNGENTIAVCLDSLLRQTYPFFEIIIINDGSTDATESICKEYANLCERITYIKKEREGQGKARNLGIQKSTADYLVFIDADDYVSDDYIEALLEKAFRENADVVTCDYHLKYGRSNKPEIRHKQEKSNDDYFFLSIDPIFCAKIWKRKLFIDNQIEQPAQAFEDIAVVPLLLAIAESISYTNRCVYYYVKWDESTTDSTITLEDRINALHILVEGFKKYGVFNRYYVALHRFVQQRSLADIYKWDNLMSRERIRYIDKHNALLSIYFDDSADSLKNIIVIGSYSGYRVTSSMLWTKVSGIFLESSFISMVSNTIPEILECKITGISEMQKQYLRNDFEKTFTRKGVSDEKVDIVFIDLLSQLYDLGVKERGVITLSNAFNNMKIDNISLQKQSIFDKKKEWKKACDEIISILKRRYQDSRMFLICLYLTEKYKKDGMFYYFEKLDKIRKLNTILQSFYDYFCDNYQQVEVINVKNENYYYTDGDYRYGCYPWHLSDEGYLRIAKKIQEKVDYINHG